MKKNIFILILGSLLLSICGCSIQVSGLNNAYQLSADDAIKAASLHVNTSAVQVVSIDGRSVSHQSLKLSPGIHQITFYLGENNYIADLNHMLVLSANFRPNTHYTLKASGLQGWIENPRGQKVSSVVSIMHIKKELSL